MSPAGGVQHPVVVVSANATPAQIARLLAAGARDYLTKPLDIARFLATVEATLDPLSRSRAAPGRAG